MPAYALVDGVEMPLAQVSVPYSDPGFTHGWTVFETLRVEALFAHNLGAHLDRLETSCKASFIAFPGREVLQHEVQRVAELVETHLVRVRITLTAGGLRIVTGEPGEVGRLHRPIRAVRGVYRSDPYLEGSVKHGSRAAWRVAVRRSGVDDVLLVDEQRRFTEATSAAILAVIDGVLWTAPDDGRILASTACSEILERAVRRGIPIRREGPPADGPWDGLYIASSLRDLAPVSELDGVALPVWDAVGEHLAEAEVGV